MTYDPEKLRLELQSLNLTRDGDEDFDPSSDSELPEDLSCKHCGRVVLLGPPCCYSNLYDLYTTARREIAWLRKIQSKQAKRIIELKKSSEEEDQDPSPNCNCGTCSPGNYTCIRHD